MNKNDMLNALPQQCHLAACIEVSDMQLHHGLPERVIKDQLSHCLGRHLGEKSSTFIKRDAGMDDPMLFYRRATRFTAEVFVFSEAELIEYATRMYQEGIKSRVESMVAIEADLKVAAVKSDLKKSLKKQIDKALD